MKIIRRSAPSEYELFRMQYRHQQQRIKLILATLMVFGVLLAIVLGALIPSLP